MEPENETYNALIGGVDIRILRVSVDGDNASFFSTMTVNNISALKEAGVSTVSCGLQNVNTRNKTDINFDLNGSKYSSQNPGITYLMYVA